jgi:hypothetical protein
LYKRKRSDQGNFSQHLSAAVKQACESCHRIETDGDLGDLVSFRTNEFSVVVNDRLNAPNTEETMQAIGPDLEKLFAKLYGDPSASVTRRDQARSRLILDVTAQANPTMTQMAASL